MRNSTMHCQESRGRRVNCPVTCAVKSASERKAQSPGNICGKKRVDSVGVGLLAAWNEFKENVKVPKKIMEIVSKSNGVTWPVNIDTFN